MKPQEKRQTETTTTATAPSNRPQLIAVRKTCDASGTGLSHYVLMDKEVAR